MYLRKHVRVLGVPGHGCEGPSPGVQTPGRHAAQTHHAGEAGSCLSS